jgi:hypothetical protein
MSEAVRAPATFEFARGAFLRVVGALYVVAFAALYDQAPGLIGSRGLLPLPERLARLTELFGDGRILRAPTAFWCAASDGAIAAVAGVGVAAGCALLCGVLPRVAAVVAWAAFLSFAALENGSCDPTFFDWPFDLLTLEVGFLAPFLASGGLRPRDAAATPVNRIARGLLVCVLFRLMFGSALLKLSLGQEAWRSGDAVRHFVLTCPSPTGWAAAVHRAPPAVSVAATYAALATELATPFFYFGPRRARHVAAAVGVAFMAAIAAVANFRGLNVMTSALLLLLVDDAAWRGLAARRRRRAVAAEPPAPPVVRSDGLWRAVLFVPVAVTLLVAGANRVADQATGRFPLERTLPGPVARLAGDFRLVARYDLFGLVAAERPVVVVEGSADGKTWLAYEPRSIPARVDRPPARIAPSTSYLDFLLWGAPFGPLEDRLRWLGPLARRLLEGAPDVRRLFAVDPFPDDPPRYVRATLWRYAYADAEGRARGDHWRREAAGVYAPAVILRDGALVLAGG